MCTSTHCHCAQSTLYMYVVVQSRTGKCREYVPVDHEYRAVCTTTTVRRTYKMTGESSDPLCTLHGQSFDWEMGSYVHTGYAHPYKALQPTRIQLSQSYTDSVHQRVSYHPFQERNDTTSAAIRCSRRTGQERNRYSPRVSGCGLLEVRPLAGVDHLSCTTQALVTRVTLTTTA